MSRHPFDRVARWQRVIGDREAWELMPAEPAPELPRWVVMAVATNRSHCNPSGVAWRATKDGAIVTKNNRVRSFGSRQTAMAVVAELARVDA